MTFLRWAGSKKQILDTLSCCWFAATNNIESDQKRYIEGFSGSAALFFYIKPKNAVLIDVNKDLQQCLERVKVSPKGVSIAIKKWSCNEEDYYKVRSLDRDKLKPNEKAASFIFLNRNCFNGLYRTNKKGIFNVPYGGGRSGSLPDYKSLLKASEILKNADIVSGDFFEEVSSRVAEGDFIYLDPPYAKKNASLDNQYGPDVFGLSDLEGLDTLLKFVDSKGAYFLVSYAFCEEIRFISDQWFSYKVQVRRSIAANKNSRKLENEIIFTNIR